MKNMLLLFLVGVILGSAGCSTASVVRVGSLSWYEARIAEIEEAYAGKEINKAKYLELKNAADLIRKEYQDDRDGYGHFGYGYGHGHRGSRIGVGVGF